ncbi:MAG TPA: Fic family protein [Methanocorpusculum sp.]|nr:Fic family protein [Methanocorpusculum sp.]
MTFDPQIPYDTLPLLPPKVNLETPAVWKACNAATLSLARLSEALHLIPNPDILISSLSLLEAASSSEIENIFTTCDSLYQAMSTDLEHTDPSTKEVLNYREALYAGFHDLQKNPQISEEMITHVCSTILGKPVVRRNCGVYIGNEKSRVYTPPADAEVIDTLLHQLAGYMNSPAEPDPLICLALIHYQFEAIHPFIDGNGRTGRILNILYLIRQKRLALPVLYLSKFIIENKSEYYRLLHNVTANGEFEEWVIFMLHALRETADWTYEKVHAVYDLMKRTADFCREKLPNHMYSYELVELIFLQPYCKPKHLIDAGIGNRQTAMKYLKELEALGVLSSQKISREKVYVNKALYALVSG